MAATKPVTNTLDYIKYVMLIDPGTGETNNFQTLHFMLAKEFSEATKLIDKKHNEYEVMYDKSRDKEVEHERLMCRSFDFFIAKWTDAMACTGLDDTWQQVRAELLTSAKDFLDQARFHQGKAVHYRGKVETARKNLSDVHMEQVALIGKYHENMLKLTRDIEATKGNYPRPPKTDAQDHSSSDTDVNGGDSQAPAIQMNVKGKGKADDSGSASLPFPAFDVTITSDNTEAADKKTGSPIKGGSRVNTPLGSTGSNAKSEVSSLSKTMAIDGKPKKSKWHNNRKKHSYRKGGGSGKGPSSGGPGASGAAASASASAN